MIQNSMFMSCGGDALRLPSSRCRLFHLTIMIFMIAASAQETTISPTASVTTPSAAITSLPSISSTISSLPTSGTTASPTLLAAPTSLTASISAAPSPSSTTIGPTNAAIPTAFSTSLAPSLAPFSSASLTLSPTATPSAGATTTRPTPGPSAAATLGPTIATPGSTFPPSFLPTPAATNTAPVVALTQEPSTDAGSTSTGEPTALAPVPFLDTKAPASLSVDSKAPSSIDLPTIQTALPTRGPTPSTIDSRAPSTVDIPTAQPTTPSLDTRAPSRPHGGNNKPFKPLSVNELSTICYEAIKQCSCPEFFRQRRQCFRDRKNSCRRPRTRADRREFSQSLIRRFKQNCNDKGYFEKDYSSSGNDNGGADPPSPTRPPQQPSSARPTDTLSLAETVILCFPKVKQCACDDFSRDSRRTCFKYAKNSCRRQGDSAFRRKFSHQLLHDYKMYCLQMGFRPKKRKMKIGRRARR